MSLVLQHIEKLKPYTLGALPPDGTEAIKLNQNESPYPPSQGVLYALRTMAEEGLRRYPDPTCSELRAELASAYGVKKEMIFCGNGSSEIISLIVKVFVGPGGRIAIPDPSFGLYHTVAASQQAGSVAVPTKADFTIDIDGLLAQDVQAIVLVNPNAPTGLLTPLPAIERLVSAFSGLVVVDEAYIDFAEPGTSALSLLDRYDNLIVVRTFSKAYALCGARVGYCFGAVPLIEALDKGKDIYNVNSISRALALAALQDKPYTEQTIKAVKRTRDAFCEELRQMGFSVLPSQTNFVLSTLPEKIKALGVQKVHDDLVDRNIYVRYFEHPRLADKLRISIGTAAEMSCLLETLRSLLQSYGEA